MEQKNAVILLLLLLNRQESPWNDMSATFNLNMYMPPSSDKYLNISSIQYSHHMSEVRTAHLKSSVKSTVFSNIIEAFQKALHLY